MFSLRYVYCNADENEGKENNEKEKNQKMNGRNKLKYEEVEGNEN